MEIQYKINNRITVTRLIRVDCIYHLFMTSNWWRGGRVDSYVVKHVELFGIPKPFCISVCIVFKKGEFNVPERGFTQSHCACSIFLSSP